MTEITKRQLKMIQEHNEKMRREALEEYEDVYMFYELTSKAKLGLTVKEYRERGK